MHSAGLTLVASGKPMHYDEDAVEKAIFSIPDSARERLNQFLVAEKANQEASTQWEKQRGLRIGKSVSVTTRSS